MAYTGTDLNKAEKGYVDEQDQALQDQIDLADFVTELDANDFDAGSYFKVEDDGSGTNNVFVSKTIAEMKADLDYKLPLNTWIGGGSFIYYSGQDYSAISSLIYNDFGITPTLTANGNGSYILQLPASFAISKGVGILQYEYGSILNALPSGYTMEIDETTHGWNIQFKNAGVNSNLPSALSGVTFKVFVQKWKE